MEEEQIEVIGARAHNLKDISLTIPFDGPSGAIAPLRMEIF